MSMPSLSRTSSTASISSSDDAGTSSGATALRRTRKRFTNDQLTMLENLFHQNSHPSREERDAVATRGGMETKSVTIWFQNKRQTERKSALNGTTNSRGLPRTSSLILTVTTGRPSRPSLDSIASRSELPMPPPQTPTRRRDPNATIWDNMPSSPLASPFSPHVREYVEFNKSQRSKRTLEWACAAARLSDRHSTTAFARPRSKRAPRMKEKEWIRAVNLDLTDDETDEAITPPSTVGGGDLRWTTEPEGKLSSSKPEADDDDMMKAALLLCGLGRRPS